MITWCGEQFQVRPLPPAAAGCIAGLADTEKQITSVVCLLGYAGIPIARALEALNNQNETADILDLVGAILKEGSARPWKSTIGLCSTVVSQWSTIRGRLIDKGIHDPLTMIPTLTALLDVVEIMILDSMEKKEDRERFLNDMYRRDNTLEPPPGWKEETSLERIL